MFQLDSDIYNKSRAQGLSEKLGGQQIAASQNTMAVNDQKMKENEIARLVAMVTPENYGAIRQEAIAKGLGTEQTMPVAYDENYISNLRAHFIGASAGNTPSAVQEYNFYNKLGTPEEKETYLNVKRQGQVINLGGTQVVRNPTGGISETYNVTPKPDEMPEFKGQQATETAKGKIKGEGEGNSLKKAMQAPEAINMLNDALTLLPKSTSGGAATMGKNIAGFFGSATDSSAIDSQLEIIANALVQNVPRMEGPQSNYDVALYRQAAGDLANTSKPREVRIAAANKLVELYNRYAGLNGGDSGGADTTGGGGASGDGWSVEEVQ